MAEVVAELDIADSEHLIVDEGVDITDETTLSQDLFSGVVSVINCAGAQFGDSPEDIDYKGNSAGTNLRPCPFADCKQTQVCTRIPQVD